MAQAESGGRDWVSIILVMLMLAMILVLGAYFLMGNQFLAWFNANGGSSDNAGADSRQTEQLRLGALMPLTGDLEAYGKSSRKGVKLAVDEIDADGGVFGKDIKLKVADTETDPQTGIDTAQRLISLKDVSGLIGAMSSGVTVPVAKKVTSEKGIPEISNASTTPAITDLDDNDFLFRTTPSDAFQGKAMAQAAQQKGLSKISVLYVDNDYGEGLAKNFKKAFQEEGGTVPAMVAFDKGNASYSNELSQADTSGAETLAVIGYPATGTRILQQALKDEHFGRFVFSDGLKAPEIVKAVGADALRGSFGTSAQALAGTSAAKHFTEAYEKHYGNKPPKPYIDSAYDAVYLFTLAAEAADSTDPVAIRDELRNVANRPGEQVEPGEWKKAARLLDQGKDINYQGASGSVDFYDSGDVGGTFALWVIKNGKIQTEKVFAPR